ncbi:hypothetical protein LOZ21_006766, partial [Ophidiomyces ophidiicola]
MAGRPKRRRLNPDGFLTQHTELMKVDKASWKGFCEIESEPALFNVMLEEFGVNGVKVQEVVSLDDEMLQSLNVALLNIVNNVTEVDLGEHLRAFKDFTMGFTPALRGDAISNFEFIKETHNSFARGMDILSIDLQLKNDTTSKKSRIGKRNQIYDESAAGFHFIAFVPVNGKYVGGDWLDLAKPEIQSRMAEYEEDQIEFSILSLARDPIFGLVHQLAVNVKSLAAVEDQLRDRHSIHNIEPCDGATVTGPDSSFNLTAHILDGARVSEDDIDSYKSASKDILLDFRKVLLDVQREIRLSIKEEQQTRDADQGYARKRRHDYGPAVYKWVQILASKGLVECLAEEIPAIYDPSLPDPQPEQSKFSLAITYPAEFAKTRTQLNHRLPDGKKLPWPPFGIRFVAFDTFKSFLQDNEGKISGPRTVVAGFGAGFTESLLAVTPFENDRKSGNPRMRGFVHGTTLIFRERGIRGFFQGFVPTTARQAANSATRFGSYTTLRQFAQGYVAPGEKLGTLSTFAIGGMAGLVTVYVTQPLDTVKTRMQSIEARNSYNNSFECAAKILRDEGIFTFWSGAVPRLARLILSGGIVFTMYEKTMEGLDALDPNR